MTTEQNNSQLSKVYSISIYKIISHKWKIDIAPFYTPSIRHRDCWWWGGRGGKKTENMNHSKIVSSGYNMNVAFMNT